MDRLKSLTTFVHVVENGGFSAAARRLNMSPTMASEHVQALEDQLGARLLQRTTRRISLTEAGQVYYENAARILSELEEADRRVGALQSTPRGRLRLHVGTHIVRFVAPVLTEYMALYPDLSVELTMGERMVDLLEEGYDLAIRATVPADSSLVIRQLAAWRHVPCCSPSYLQSHDEPRTPAELAQHNCLRYAFYPYGDEWRFAGPGGAAVSARVKGSLRTNSAEALRIAALGGLGIFLAPGFLVAEDLEAGRLAPLLGEYRPVAFAINAIYPTRHRVSAKVRAFIDLAVERFRAPPPSLNPALNPAAP
jgi:DNA-binding transcriptional LysR family regulator